MLCTLNEILEYKNQPVVNRFKKDFPDKANRAEDIWFDLLRFFWGTKKHVLDRRENPDNIDLKFVFIMDNDMGEIDQMWHIFLLFTRDYEGFCKKYFGEFLHHQPDLVPLFEGQGFEFKTNLERFLKYSYELFGEEVIRRWFANTLASA